MSSANLAAVEIKAFVPARDFELSMAFYQARRRREALLALAAGFSGSRSSAPWMWHSG
jgi:hypothetical protein